jgi:hypothetical protein
MPRTGSLTYLGTEHHREERKAMGKPGSEHVLADLLAGIKGTPKGGLDARVLVPHPAETLSKGEL